MTNGASDSDRNKAVSDAIVATKGETSAEKTAEAAPEPATTNAEEKANADASANVDADANADVNADASRDSAPDSLPPPPRSPWSRLVALSLRARIAVGAGAAIAVTAMIVAVALLSSRHKTETNATPALDAAIAVAQNDPDASLLDGSALAAADAIDSGPPLPPAWRIRDLKDDKTIEIVEGKIGKHPFGAALAHVPIPRGEIQRIVKAFDGVHSFDRCQPQDNFIVARDRTSGRILAFEYLPKPEELYQAREDDGVLHGKEIALRVVHTKKTAAFVVKDDLKHALKEAGFEDDVLPLVADALEGHAEISDVRPGARVRLVAVEERIEGDLIRTSDLPALEYIANEKSEALRVYHYERAHEGNEHVRPKDKHVGFYDAKGQRPFRGGFRTPIPFAHITSRFNPHRMHPVLHVMMPHNGIDFAASPGTPVYASAGGVVHFAGDSGPCGNMVQIEHPGGLITSYCHLSKFAAGIHPGMRVETRQLIGFSGQTGRVTGPHLHFAAKRGEIFIDPQALRLDGVRVIPPQDRDAFQLRRVELDKTLDAIPAPWSPVPANANADDDDGGADDDIMDTVDVPDAQ